MIKLYNAITKGGFTLFKGVPLSLLEEKLELTLNDLLQADSLEKNEFLDRKVRISVEKEIYDNMYSKREKDRYLLTIQRVQ